MRKACRDLANEAKNEGRGIISMYIYIYTNKKYIYIYTYFFFLTMQYSMQCNCVYPWMQPPFLHLFPTSIPHRPVVRRCPQVGQITKSFFSSFVPAL